MAEAANHPRAVWHLNLNFACHRDQTKSVGQFGFHISAWPGQPRQRSYHLGTICPEYTTLLQTIGTFFLVFSREKAGNVLFELLRYLFFHALSAIFIQKVANTHRSICQAGHVKMSSLTRIDKHKP